MVGLPGAGKTTWSRTYAETHDNVHIVSTDSYFMRDGVYQFSASLLQLAHCVCLREFITLCQLGHNVVCDNCNVTPHTLGAYVAIARAYDYDTRIVMCKTADPGISFARQRHNVDQVQCNWMRQHLNKMLESWPGIWPELEVVRT